MAGCIYKITNLKNNKIYIGQTIQKLNSRWNLHVCSAKTDSETKIARAIRKYGKENFSIEVLELCDDLDSREEFYIELFKSVKFGYNIRSGGNCVNHSKETIEKISKANRKREWTDEMRQNMSIAIKEWHKKRGFVPRDEVFKNKISEANRKRKMSEKCRKIFQEYNKKKSKPIFCLTNETEYPSIVAACKSLNLNDGHLRHHLAGKCSHIKGYIFKVVR